MSLNADLPLRRTAGRSVCTQRPSDSFSSRTASRGAGVFLALVCLEAVADVVGTIQSGRVFLKSILSVVGHPALRSRPATAAVDDRRGGGSLGSSAVEDRPCPPVEPLAVA